MKAFKRILCLCLMLAMLAGLALTGHALGASLSGTVTSGGEASSITTLLLTRVGAVVPDSVQAVTGSRANYRLAGITAGTYILTAAKEGHVTRTYIVTVGNKNTTLDVKLSIKGDINGDGKINVADVSQTYAHIRKTRLITDTYKLACADYNGDGKINVGDTAGIYSEVKSGKRPAKAVTLKVWSPSEDQYEDGWLLQMEERFQKAHPEYRITWDNQVCNEGDAGSMVSRDPEAAADVYMFANDQLGTLKDAGAITELTGKYREQVLKDNSPVMVNTVTYTDGGIYAFPLTSNTWFMYYNKDVFTEEDVKSLDTMLTKGRVAFQWGTSWYGGTFFFANGGKCFGDNGLDAAAGVQFGEENGGYDAALKMVQLAANPNFKDDANGLGNAGLKDGSIDAYFSGSWDYAALYEELGDKLGAVQLPTVEIGGVQKQMKAFAGSKAVAVNPHSDNQELAMEFAACLATPEAQKLRYQLRGVIPATASLAKDPEIAQNEVAMAEINTVTNASVVQPIIPEMGNYWTPVGNFGGMVSCFSITEENYKENVNWMMEALNSPGL